MVLLLFFQIAYRTASDRFPGRLSELFLVLSDDLPTAATSEVASSQPLGRGHKHRLDDDQMSTESGKDQSASAEKNKSKSFGRNKPKPKPK